ncbi:Holliday junction resolvase RuvX [Campylobacter suis]|uniref:Putative pre-16S rRNA nuclease n=1 Tax=Campylobacter suis TaxID=2790657 RepID=A0ABM8Q2Y1_9BACT|nr:Holliday junction resolvase RuvX [Campylobacter suis]CAD7287207.1 Putative pre-16S rRNA nuclease [Campylobacter suis]
MTSTKKIKIIALDIGLKRIGMAFSYGEVVLPLTPILRKNRNQAARDVSEAIRQREAEILVVGVPLGGASEDEMKRRISHFVSLLEFDGEIFYQDEALSSFEASELTKDERDGKFDSVAAMIILKRYINKTNKA